MNIAEEHLDELGKLKDLADHLLAATRVPVGQQMNNEEFMRGLLELSDRVCALYVAISREDQMAGS
jgi:hypothetical protein